MGFFLERKRVRRIVIGLFPPLRFFSYPFSFSSRARFALSKNISFRLFWTPVFFARTRFIRQHSQLFGFLNASRRPVLSASESKSLLYMAFAGLTTFFWATRSRSLTFFMVILIKRQLFLFIYLIFCLFFECLFLLLKNLFSNYIMIVLNYPQWSENSIFNRNSLIYFRY